MKALPDQVITEEFFFLFLIVKCLKILHGAHYIFWQIRFDVLPFLSSLINTDLLFVRNLQDTNFCYQINYASYCFFLFAIKYF